MSLRHAWIVILLMWLPAMVCAQSYQLTSDQRPENITKADIMVPSGLQSDDLQQTKAKLDQEYAELVKEIEILKSMAETPFTEEGLEVFKEKVSQFNERKADYENRINEFQQQVDAFHQQQAVEAEAFTKTEKQKAAAADDLVKTKAELDKEYSDLMKEREATASECKNPATTEAYETCKQKVAEFNKRRADYERRAKEYQEKAEAFNNLLK